MPKPLRASTVAQARRSAVVYVVDFLTAFGMGHYVSEGAEGKQEGEAVNTEPPKKEIDHRLQDFEAATLKTYEAAEAHLGLMTGTLSRIRSERNFMLVMMVAATIEPLINELLTKDILAFRRHKAEVEGSQELADYVTNRRIDRRAKLALARDMGHIHVDHYKFADAIYLIRDHYAHHIGNMGKLIIQIAETKDKDAARSTIKALCSVDIEKPNGRITAALWMEAGIYYNFASLLSAVLNVVKPPPLPKGGLLGAYASLTDSGKS